MSDYHAPLKDMLFLLEHVFEFSHEELDMETAGAVLEEAAKLAGDVLAPLNWTGDQEGCTLESHVVTTPKGFKDAYAQYRDGGWPSVQFEEEYGGQALPYAIAFPVQEMWQAANMSFGLCPLLTLGAAEAISHHGSQELKDMYMPKLVSGEWTGTMNLTEPQAGSDLGILRSKAEPAGDGTYKITGQKIYITHGEHDFTDNIVHLVLARLPDAPDDVKGISLFIVPKFLEDGTRNDVKCTGLEHKLGIHASPTCTMQFGDEGGATGYIVGEPHEGLKYMFTMMNSARLNVGLQGVAVADRSLQHASAYAADRVQGKSFTTGERVSIDQHADVKRMLLFMRSHIEAGRAMAYEAAFAMDAGDQAKVDLLTPIVKSWCTDMALAVTSEGVQVHGGMGFVEETGAAQYYRDARILPIYEGTNGIQAADLAFRKTVFDNGQATKAYVELMKIRAPALSAEFDALWSATEKLLKLAEAKDMDGVAMRAKPYLNAFGILAGAALLAKSAELAEGHDDQEFAAQKKETAEFYMIHVLPFATAHLASI